MPTRSSVSGVPMYVKALKAMNPGIVRIGGTTIESFEWQKTVGSWDTRAPFSDDPWGGLQENFVGIEEFVQMVQYIGAEPMICVRWTGKTPQDAADEIEYFNGNADTRWGRIRAKNGHPAPYHVKYWQIGNEIGVPEYDRSLKAFGASHAPGGSLHQNPVLLAHRQIRCAWPGASSIF